MHQKGDIHIDHTRVERVDAKCMPQTKHSELMPDTLQTILSVMKKGRETLSYMNNANNGLVDILMQVVWIMPIVL